MRANILIVMPITALVVTACSGSSGDNTGTSQNALTGPIELRAVASDDSPAAMTQPLPPEVAGLTKIVVTIDHVEAKVDVDPEGRSHDDDAWTTIATGPFTLDLLSLEGQSFASLAIAKLPATDLDGLRLVLASAGPDFVVTSGGETLPLIVPSGQEAGIRVTGDLDAVACATGYVTLEFAGRHAIELHLDGDKDTYVMRPVLRVREVVTSGTCPNSDEQGDQERGRGR